jgi:hypothetical protein
MLVSVTRATRPRLFPASDPPPKGWDPGAAWVVQRVLRPYRNLAFFFYAGQRRWQSEGRQKATYAWPYVLGCISLEAVALVVVRDFHHVAAVKLIAYFLIVFRAAELGRVYLELLLEWVHDTSLRMERNLVLLFVNFIEFTLLGAIGLFLTTPHVGMAADWYDAFAELTLYGLPHGGSFSRHVVCVVLALAALLLLACGLAVILTHVASKFENSGQSSTELL